MKNDFNILANELRQPQDTDKSNEIDFYFDFTSPYGWIGAEKIVNLAERYNKKINWRPFLLSVTVLEIMKADPPLGLPLKGNYLLHDIKRTTRFHGLPLSDKAKFGFNSVYACRAVIWARQETPEMVAPLVLALYRAHWMHARNIDTVQTVIEITRETGLCPHNCEKTLKDPAIKETFQNEVDSAVENGVFGSPTFVVAGEPFWGSDRMPMLEKWLEQGGW